MTDHWLVLFLRVPFPIWRVYPFRLCRAFWPRCPLLCLWVRFKLASRFEKRQTWCALSIDTLTICAFSTHERRAVIRRLSSKVRKVNKASSKVGKARYVASGLYRTFAIFGGHAYSPNFFSSCSIHTKACVYFTWCCWCWRRETCACFSCATPLSDSSQVIFFNYKSIVSGMYESHQSWHPSAVSRPPTTCKERTTIATTECITINLWPIQNIQLSRALLPSVGTSPGLMHSCTGPDAYFHAKTTNRSTAILEIRLVTK